VLPLVPVLGFVPFLYQRFSTVADRYAYVSLLGAGAGAAFGMAWLMRRLPRQRVPIMAAVVCVAAVLGFGCWRQSGFWSDSGRLWRRQIALQPDSHDAWNNLGEHFLRAGRRMEAMDALATALKLNPREAKALLSIAALHRQQGNLPESIAAAQRACDLVPGDYRPYAALSQSYLEAGRGEAAQSAAAKAVDLKMDDPQLLCLQARALASLKRYLEAERLFLRAFQLDPNSVEAAYGMGMCLATRGMKMDAVGWLERAMRLDPKKPEAARALGDVWSGKPVR
jgi:tetratricopeptide (TPR) repeat protein